MIIYDSLDHFLFLDRVDISKEEIKIIKIDIVPA